jgi:leader peptidase (prepilin peptidase)/N-methyltransferase
MHDILATLADLFRTFPAAWLALAAVLGLVLGSFLNVVIHRLPIILDREWRAQAKEVLATASPAGAPNPEVEYTLAKPRSACPKCGALITAGQNIPVVSYLLQGGKCANCKAKISKRYPIVELATAVLSFAVAWRFGFSWFTVGAWALTWALIALAVIDFDHQILPDNITLPLLWLGVFVSLIGYPGHESVGQEFPIDLRSSVIGAIAGYLSLWAVYHAFKLITGKEGMGFGDFKLFGALGAWLGWQMLPLVIVLSAFTGAVVGVSLILFRGRDRNIPIPFGPYLAAAGWIALMWGHDIVGGYMHFAGIRG